MTGPTTGHDTRAVTMTVRTAVAKVFDRWQKADHMRLCAGEISAQEVRTAKAILQAVAWEVDRELFLNGETAPDTER